MKELHRRSRQRNFARPLEAAQKIKFDTRQAATRPIDRGHDLRGSALCVNQLRLEEELVMVAHNATAAEFAEDLDDGIRSRSQRSDVTKTDDLVYNGSADPRARRGVPPRSRGYPKSGQYASSE
jgi:hypothetical protein